MHHNYLAPSNSYSTTVVQFPSLIWDWLIGLILLAFTEKEMDVGGELPEALCSICRSPFDCDDDYGSSCQLPCGCHFHLSCFTRFLRSKLENRSLLVIGNTIQGHLRGILCPNVSTGYCLDESSLLLSYEFLNVIYLQGTIEKLDNVLTEEEFSKLIRWTFEEQNEVQNLEKVEEVRDPLLLSTTKPCPNCKYRATHPHGHGCHHISPSGGCRICAKHYCYKCLRLGEENLRIRGLESNCLCGFWSSYCSNFSNREEIKRFLAYDPYPHDKRCLCVICSDCKRNSPCSQCDGNCAVCKGHLPPGPVCLADISDFKAAVQEMQNLSPLYLIFSDACRYSDWNTFKQVVSEVGFDEVPVNERDDDNRTLLHHACHHVSPNARKIIECLVEQCRADPAALDAFGKSCFEYAMQAYLSMNLRAVHYSSIPGYDQQSRFSIIKILMEKVGSQFLDKLYLDNGKSFVLWATEQKDVLSALFDLFPDWEYFDEGGRNLLYIGMQERNFPLVLMVLNRSKHCSINITIDGVPLVALVGEIAMEQYRESTVRIKDLVTKKAICDWNLVDSHLRTVLHSALYLWAKQQTIAMGLLNIINSLAQLMCKATHIEKSTLQDNQGNNLLHLCLACQNHKLFDCFMLIFRKYPFLLLEQNCRGDTPFHYLVRIPYFVEVFEKIVKLQPALLLPFHVANMFMRTPLHNFCMFNEETVLVHQSQNLRERAHSSCTVDSNDSSDSEAAKEIVLYLKDHPQLIDFAAKDYEGSTVLHLVFRHENLLTFRFLASLARDSGKPLPFHQRDFRGNTCLHIICHVGSKILLDSFLHHYQQSCEENGRCQWIIMRLLNFDDECVFHTLIRQHPNNFNLILGTLIKCLPNSDRQLISVQNRMKETPFDMICAGDDFEGLALVATLLSEQKILAPKRLPTNPHQNNRHALMLLLLNERLREYPNFPELFATIFKLVVSLDILMQVDGDGNSLLHYVARLGLHDILNAAIPLIQKDLLICTLQNKQKCTFLQVLLDNDRGILDHEYVNTAESSFIIDSIEESESIHMHEFSESEDLLRKQNFCIAIVQLCATEGKEENQKRMAKSFADLIPSVIQAQLPPLCFAIVSHFGSSLGMDEIRINDIFNLGILLLGQPDFFQSFHSLLKNGWISISKEQLLSWLADNSFLYPHSGLVDFDANMQIQRMPLLHYLCKKVHESGHYSVLSSVLALKLLDMNAIDENTGSTIAHFSCIVGDVVLVQILIDYGANYFEGYDNEGYTPYARACEYEYEAIKTILLHHQTEKFQSQSDL